MRMRLVAQVAALMAATVALTLTGWQVIGESESPTVSVTTIAAAGEGDESHADEAGEPHQPAEAEDQPAPSAPDPSREAGETPNDQIAARTPLSATADD